MDQICAELEAIDEGKKTKSKPKVKRAKTVPTQQKLPPLMNEKVEEKDQHTCLNGETSSPKIVNILPTTKKSTKSSKCNTSTRTNKTKKRLIVSESTKCECDDESKFVHDHLPMIDACEKSCCFDIIEYWNRLVQEEEDAKRKVVPRRLKVNYIDGENDHERITDEDKREYFENRGHYLALRMEKRRQLIQNWNLRASQQLKLIVKTKN